MPAIKHPDPEQIRELLPSSISLLDWDTQHFGFPVGRIKSDSIGDSDLADSLRMARSAGVALVYWTVSDDRVLADDVRNRLGGCLADRRATFNAQVADLLDSPILANEPGVVVYEYPKSPATKELTELGVLAGTFSRFCKDVHIPRKKFESLYRTWADRSARRDIADMVLVAALGKQSTLGFVTISDRDGVGVIGLIAVSEVAQGRGVGSRLLNAAHHWMADNAISTASVATQIANVPACKLYARAGYELVAVENVYHFWLHSIEN